MIIFLGIMGELTTVILSVIISVKGALDGLLELSKNGFKLDQRTLKEMQRIQQEEKKKRKIFSKVLGAIILFIPGVNILKSSITVHQLKKQMMDDPELRKFIVPMSEEEMDEYAKIKGYGEKLSFASCIVDSDKKQETEEFKKDNNIGSIGIISLTEPDNLEAKIIEEINNLSSNSVESDNLDIIVSNQEKDEEMANSTHSSMGLTLRKKP